METLVLHIPTDKKVFFLSLLKELPFVQVDDVAAAEEAAVMESEKAIAEGRTLTHSALKEEIQGWRQR